MTVWTSMIDIGPLIYSFRLWILLILSSNNIGKEILFNSSDYSTHWANTAYQRYFCSFSFFIKFYSALIYSL